MYFIAADLTVTLVESYFIVSVSSIFFAFGVNSITSSMTKKLVNECIGLGLKLMMLYTIIGVGTTMGQQWSHILSTVDKSHPY